MSIRQRRRRPGMTAHAQTDETPPLRTRDPFAIRPTAGRVERTLADAAQLPNPRHEIFAQAIASGIPRAEAYDRAGYGGIDSYQGATHLLSRVDIANRITTLQGKAAAHVAVTVESLVLELEEARVMAKAESQPAAMVAATREKAVLLGLRVEKRDITTREGDPSGLTDDELALIARGGGDGTDPAPADQDKPSPMVH